MATFILVTIIWHCYVHYIAGFQCGVTYFMSLSYCSERLGEDFLVIAISFFSNFVKMTFVCTNCHTFHANHRTECLQSRITWTSANKGLNHFLFTSNGGLLLSYFVCGLLKVSPQFVPQVIHFTTSLVANPLFSLICNYKALLSHSWHFRFFNSSPHTFLWTNK